MSSLTIWEWLQSANSSLPRSQKRACDRLVRHHEAWGLENAAYNGLKVESTLMGNWKTATAEASPSIEIGPKADRSKCEEILRFLEKL